MGKAAQFTMHWSSVLDGSFYKLDFENRRQGEGSSEIIFKAQAHYRVIDSTLIVGTWLDNRGVILPLSGTVTENRLMINWGDHNTEMGKTNYHLSSAEIIEAEDYVQKDSTYHQFGTATYQLIKK